MPKIRNIEIHRVDLELTRPYTIAFRTVNHVENAVVNIMLDNGVVGWGAGNPSPMVVGETLDQTLKALGVACNKPVHKDPWQRLLDRDIADLDQLCREIQEHLPQTPAARTALEVALYDAFCQWKGVPLVDYLGQKVQSLSTSITIGIKGVEDTLEEAKEYIDLGFRIIKVKLGNDHEEDQERVIKLRERFGPDVVLRVDANQGYTVEELKQFYYNTADSNIELVEQPLPAGQVDEMKSLPKEIKKILAADESLIGLEDARELAEDPGACGIFNIKLMKCGGISTALAIAELARKADIDLMWGCNDESIITITAALHTALACENTKYLDLDGNFDLAKDVVSGGFALEEGRMRVNGRPGLGLTDMHLL